MLLRTPRAIKFSALLTAMSVLCACVTAREPRATSTPQEAAARDTLYKGCLEQRLYEAVDEYLDKQFALAQIGAVRYETYLCECTANAAAKRPYVAAILARLSSGQELNENGEHVLKGETFASLLQCTSTWLDQSAAEIANRLGALTRNSVSPGSAQ